MPNVGVQEFEQSKRADNIEHATNFGILHVQTERGTMPYICGSFLQFPHLTVKLMQSSGCGCPPSSATECTTRSLITGISFDVIVEVVFSHKRRWAFLATELAVL